MDVHAAQWIGMREKMEDAYAVSHFPQGALAVVCDGMGGHSHGDLAARAAADAFCAAFARLADMDDVPRRLRVALDEANEAVGALLLERGGEFGGTTLLAAFVTRHLLYHISVGDSALFLWRGDSLSRLNEDHSMRAFYQGFGPECAMPDSHCLRSALTGEPPEMLDAPPQGFPLLPHDRIILASDGVEELLFDCAPKASVRRILSSTDTPLAPALVQAVEALRFPLADNVTVLTLDAE